MQANRQKVFREFFAEKGISEHDEPLCDCLRSFCAGRRIIDWGCRVWGKTEAQRWVRELRTAISKQLSLMRKGFPLAPRDDEFSEEIRQMIVGRYRVLFTIRKHKIHILHVRGAHI